MKWQEIRARYPGEWLLVEAIKAHSEANKRIVEELSVVRVFPDSGVAMKSYIELHHDAPERELYVLHTDREELDITERWWGGIRPSFAAAHGHYPAMNRRAENGKPGEPGSPAIVAPFTGLHVPAGEFIPRQGGHEQSSSSGEARSTC